MPARILAAHNQVRAEAGVPPLTWDRALGDAAANYAVYLAVTNSFQHSDPSNRGGAGENLWMGTRGAFSFEAMVGGWSSERRDFLPGVFPAVSRAGSWEKVGHYTQMVWPTTTRSRLRDRVERDDRLSRLPLLAGRQRNREAASVAAAAAAGKHGRGASG